MYIPGEQLWLVNANSRAKVTKKKLGKTGDDPSFSDSQPHVCMSFPVNLSFNTLHFVEHGF